MWIFGRKRPPGDAAEDRWHSHPVLSALVNAIVFVTPIALSIVSATIAAHLLPRPRGIGLWVGWWVVVLGVPTVMLVATDRIARRALPLAVLLKMTMVFPDHAPKRLAVARKAGSIRDLARRVEEARTRGIDDEPVLAAEKILVLAGALNAHDRLTRGHGERVRAYTDLIAEELDVPAGGRDRLRWSALLHDIGKLAVHPDILNKPGKLNEDEWAIIKIHPLEGAKLTAPLAPWLGEWANTIAEHHEKYDGTGYPYGLKGDEISLGGRIVAVADCYDTMTAIRTYRQPISPEAARTELAACAGSHFDPKMVRAFLDVSIGRVRPVSGPLAWLGSLPFVSRIPQLGQVASVLGRVGAAIVTVGAAVTLGALHVETRSVRPLAGHSAASPKTGRLGTTGTSANGSPTTQADQLGKAGPSGGASVVAAEPSPGKSTVSGTTAARPARPAPGGTSFGATTTIGPGSQPPPTSAPLGGVPITASLTIRNGSGQAGRPDQGDQIIVTFSAAPSPTSFCSAWSVGAHPDLADPNVSVKMSHPQSGDDAITSVTDSSDCATGFHFGGIDMGQTGYLKNSANFGGGTSQCSGTESIGCTRIHWDGKNTLTITLGSENVGQLTNLAPSVAVYTLDPALGRSGTITSKRDQQF